MAIPDLSLIQIKLMIRAPFLTLPILTNLPSPALTLPGLASFLSLRIKERSMLIPFFPDALFENLPKFGKCNLVTNKVDKID